MTFLQTRLEHAPVLVSLTVPFVRLQQRMPLSPSLTAPERSAKSKRGSITLTVPASILIPFVTMSV